MAFIAPRRARRSLGFGVALLWGCLPRSDELKTASGDLCGLKSSYKEFRAVSNLLNECAFRRLTGRECGSVMALKLIVDPQRNIETSSTRLKGANEADFWSRTRTKT